MLTQCWASGVRSVNGGGGFCSRLLGFHNLGFGLQRWAPGELFPHPPLLQGRPGDLSTPRPKQEDRECTSVGGGHGQTDGVLDGF